MVRRLQLTDKSIMLHRPHYLLARPISKLIGRRIGNPVARLGGYFHPFLKQDFQQAPSDLILQLTDVNY